MDSLNGTMTAEQFEALGESLSGGKGVGGRVAWVDRRDSRGGYQGYHEHPGTVERREYSFGSNKLWIHFDRIPGEARIEDRWVDEDECLVIGY